MLYLKALATVALVGSIAWTIADPGFEPALSAAGSLSALASAFVVEKRTAKRAEQSQSISESSIGVQAGGDVHIGQVGVGKDAR